MVSFKKAEVGDGYIIRLFEPIDIKLAEVKEVNMLEKYGG